MGGESMEACMAILTAIGGMPGIVAAIVALVFVAFILTPRVARAEEEQPAPASAPKVTVRTVKGLNRAEIEKKLQKLAETPPPGKLSHGAKCYAVAAPPTRAEYVCPTCGEKTLYTKQAAEMVGGQLLDARRQVKILQELAGAGLDLDESQFCRKCSPDVKDPKLVLKIRYDGGKTKTVSGISPKDLQLLTEFFSDKLAHDTGAGGERPLKDYSGRLRELLGFESK
jgi:hypothetical protein